MDTKLKPCRKRFLKLSLKKNRIKSNHETKESTRDSDVIFLDESFDRLKCDINNGQSVQKVYSPIVIDDSMDLSNGRLIPNITLSPVYTFPDCEEPSRTGNVSFNGTENDLHVIELQNEKHPNVSSCWSPAQNIICAIPRYINTPSTPKDVANESIKECSMKKIEQSQKKLLSELYGEQWKTIPTLFKSQKISDYGSSIIKKLDFSEENDSDKENLKCNHAENKQLYLTSSDVKRNVRLKADSADKRSKKKLYTEKIPNTPEPASNVGRKFKRDIQTTSKKAKAKTVTELVEIMKNTGSAHSENHKNEVDYIARKVKKFKITCDVVQEVKRLSFMGSLADNVPTWRCNLEALVYKDKYKTKREELTRKLYADFNLLVFDNNLDEDMPIVWDPRLRSTAGITINRVVKTSKGVKMCTSSIKLSTKVVDGPQRLRDTLIHEMCHAATWIVDKELKAGHGPLWKKWAAKALRAIPELGEISRCHDMEIHFKYSYKCTRCGYSVNRHSKSIDITKKCCGYCSGKFEVIINKKNKEGAVVSTPARRGGPNDFALYVKENYAEAKGSMKSHAEVMRKLGEQFSAKKNPVPDMLTV